LAPKYDEFMQDIKLINSKNLLAAEGYSSSYSCLGKQSVYEQFQRRPCKFHNVCYNKTEKEFHYYQKHKEPVFYDRKKGPMYSFNDGIKGFIQVTAFDFFPNYVRYFSPKINRGVLDPNTAAFVSNPHVLWSIFAYEHNMGHLIYEVLQF
jgi:hypothetical protein